MASAPPRISGGTGSAAITNDDEYTYVEPDNAVKDFNDKTYKNIKADRSF